MALAATGTSERWARSGGGPDAEAGPMRRRVRCGGGPDAEAGWKRTQGSGVKFGPEQYPATSAVVCVGKVHLAIKVARASLK
eukprot:g35541.t1